MIPLSTFKDRLQKAMSLRGMRAADLARDTGLSKARISQYTNGIYEPKQKALCQIAKALHVNELWLMGNDVPMEQNPMFATPDVPGIFPLESRRFPMLGEIACGKPMMAYEDLESYVISGTDLHADFCLRARGDSMIGARIMDGDIVFIRSADMVSNGEIAAVVIDNEATLKRVYYYPEEQKLILTPENPKYPPLVYIGNQLAEIRILGQAIAFQSDIRL
ncbi:putative uncharacterized protein [Clostridium sp. CAG:448]|nr:putative uncharacterized protein [Clostridium sp. CAG:448]